MFFFFSSEIKCCLHYMHANFQLMSEARIFRCQNLCNIVYLHHISAIFIKLIMLLNLIKYKLIILLYLHISQYHFMYEVFKLRMRCVFEYISMDASKINHVFILSNHGSVLYVSLLGILRIQMSINPYQYVFLSVF